MGTIEKLFVQIFERKKRIIDQVKHQAFLFDQQLASHCLLKGIAPPPWLLDSATNELNKEELISGLLNPCPPLVVPYSSTYCSFYNKPAVKADTVDVPGSFCTEFHTSNKGLDAGDQLSVSPQLPVNDVGGILVQKPSPGASKCLPDQNDARLPEFSSEVCTLNEAFDAGDRLSISPQLPINDVGSALNGVQVLDSGAAKSLTDQRDERVLDVSAESACSFRNFQRSKSRHRALELHNSEKSVENNLHDGNCARVFAGGVTGFEIATLQHDHAEELEWVEPVDISKESCKVEEAQVGNSHGKEPESCEEELILESLLPGQQPTTSHSICECVPYSEPAIISENEELPDCLNIHVYASGKGFVATDRMSELHQFPVNDTGCGSNGVLNMDSGVASPKDQRNSGMSAIDPELFQSLARVQRSKSRQRALEARNSAKAAKSCLSLENDICANSAVDIGHGIASLQSDLVHTSELVKNADVKNESYEVEEAKVCDIQSKEKRSNIYSGRITRSKSLLVQSNSMTKSSNEGSLTLARRSRRNGDNACSSKSSEQQTEANSTIFGGRVSSGKVGSLPQLKQRQDEGKLVEAVSASQRLREDVVVWSNVNRCPVDKIDHEEDHMIEGSKTSLVGICSLKPEHIQELELSKPVDRFHESSAVEEAKVGDSQSKGSGSNAYSSRITRIQSSSQKVSSIRDSLNISQQAVSTSPSMKDDGDAQSNVNKIPVDKKDHTEQHMIGGSKTSSAGISSRQPEHVHELELIEHVDMSHESSAVEEAKVGDFQNEENGSNAYSGRITRSRSSSQQVICRRDSLNINNSFYTKSSNCENKNVGPISRQQNERKFVLSENQFNKGAEDSQPQHKRRKFNAQHDDLPFASQSLREEGHARSGVNKSHAVEMPQNGGHNLIEKSQSVLKLQVDEEELSLEERDAGANCTPSAPVEEELELPLTSGFANQATVDSKDSPNIGAGVANTRSNILDKNKQHAEGEHKLQFHPDDNFELGNTEHLCSAKRGMQEENGKSSDCSVGSSQRESVDLTGNDQIRPEFEGFIMKTDDERSNIAREGICFDKLDLPKNTIERASVLEQLCKSASIHTPSSHFSTTHKLHQVQNLYQSVPNGLLDCADLRSNPSINDNIVEQLKATFSCFNEEANCAFQGRSYSDCLPFSGDPSAWNIKKPFGSPVGKLWERITSNSASSEKQWSLNPELPCISEENENADELADAFREGISSEVASLVGEICDGTTSSPTCSEKRGSLNPELPFISEEKESTDEVAGIHQEGISSHMIPFSVKREPLVEITENPNLPASVSEAGLFSARSSIESVKTEYSFTGTCNRTKKKLGPHANNKKRLPKKMSHGISVEDRESVHSRFSKPKLSQKPSSRKGGPSFADSKRNNIVSNITTFIPLAKPKQAPAIITGKRDVKVKALEAAEAAKRLAQEKENERKMKREALKLERVRQEQENLKQQELEKKRKEEERKKKEADMAARKRQREEEERKEKEQKRKRMVDTLKQQRENEEKLHAKKEKGVKYGSVDEQLNVTRVSEEKKGKVNKREKEMVDKNVGKMLKCELKVTVVSKSDAIETSTIAEVCEASTACGDNSKVTSILNKAIENNHLSADQIQEPSYDISPYKGSDDEDEEEGEIWKTKFVPKWASKSAVALVISSQQSLNPELIFPPKSFCSISEVLLPRRLQQLNRGL